MFLNRGFCTTWPCKSFAGENAPWWSSSWLSPLPLPCCCRLRSLLTVTPSADLHHITEHLMLFPADRGARQKQLPGEKTGRAKCIVTIAKVLPSAKSLTLLHFFHEERETFFSFGLQLCLTFWMISYWSHLYLKYLLGEKNAKSLFCCFTAWNVRKEPIYHTIFPHLLSSFLFSHYTAKLERKCTERIEKQPRWFFPVQTWGYGNFQQLFAPLNRFHFSLWGAALPASDYIRGTPAIPDGKDLSRFIWTWKELTLAVGAGYLESGGELYRHKATQVSLGLCLSLLKCKLLLFSMQWTP